jgi:hypothetical protein
MSLQLRIIQPSEIEEILSFEKRKLQDQIQDEMEREFAMWNSRWRKEALEFYLPMGWSFLARDQQVQNNNGEAHSEGPIVGYFIAQPLLFLHGQTQSLWIEHLQYNSLQVRDELCELAWRLSKEKHFQKVYFPDLSGLANGVSRFKAEPWSPQVLEVKTTKV